MLRYLNIYWNFTDADKLHAIYRNNTGANYACAKVQTLKKVYRPIYSCLALQVPRFLPEVSLNGRPGRDAAAGIDRRTNF
jgi:hypothetical protein